MVHRDIKPENILLAGGHALVVDFGIARALGTAGGEQLTETGLVLGTPAYMSPEQSSGSGGLDGRSDLYTLGCVVYEMLAGEPPYTGPSAQAIIAKRLSEPVPHVRTVREEIPTAVDEAVTRALAKTPADRFATAREFTEALDRGLTAPAHTVPLRLPLSHRRTALLLARVAIVAITAGGFLLRRAAAPMVLDADAVSIAPFDVFGPALGLWHEGLMDLLARNLDGARPLRTVSPSHVVPGWEGPADAASARELGRRTHVGLAVFGQLVGTGTDSVRVKATLLDVASGRELGEGACSLRAAITVKRRNGLGPSLSSRSLRRTSFSWSRSAAGSASIWATAGSPSGHTATSSRPGAGRIRSYSPTQTRRATR